MPIYYYFKSIGGKRLSLISFLLEYFSFTVNLKPRSSYTILLFLKLNKLIDTKNLKLHLVVIGRKKKLALSIGHLCVYLNS